ncbi:MAG: phosphoglycolate phosphatase [Hahellaceae bacterium]|nr:phosphoglycolate phosphatase [Hahellaceae bacterium]
MVRHPVTPEQPLRLALFDLDGTLVDSVPDLAASIDAMLREFHLPEAGENRVRHWVGNGAARLVAEALHYATQNTPCPTTQEEALASFQRHYGLQCTDKTTLYPGAADLLNAWHRQGVRLAVVTNKPESFSRTILRQLGLLDLLTDVIGGDSLPERKPHPLPLQTVLARRGVPAHEAIMVGDSRHDVEAARAAGIAVICVSYGYNHGESVGKARPDRLVDSLSELG